MSGPKFFVVGGSAPNLEIALEEPIYFPKGQDVKRLVIPLRREGLSDLRNAVMGHDVRQSVLLPAPPAPPSSDYVKLLEERLAKAEERVDRLIAALVDPA